MRWLTSILLSLSIISLLAQTEELSLEEQLAQLESELDSIALFGLFDEYLNQSPDSEFGLRFSYSGSRLSAGRDFNQNQRGYSPGISYYHSSGLYLDWTTFFDNQSDGAINLSIFHAGYMWMPTTKWIVNPYFEKTFNHQNSTNELTWSMGTGVTRDFKVAELGVDYAFLWGSSVGHRLIPSMTKSFKVKRVPLLGNVSFYPSISLVAGTTTIFSYLYSDDQVEDYLTQIQSLTEQDVLALRRNGTITAEQTQDLILAIRLLESGNPDAANIIEDFINELQEENSFELLSTNLSLPVSFKIKKTSIMAGYTYSIPYRLPGEDQSVDPTGFFSFSISRRF